MVDTEPMRAADFPYFDGPFIALAHRGGADYAPNHGRENTLHAFRNAVALGYTHVETDVHATADGVLIAFHDDRLDRVTDRTGLIADLTWEQISRARIGGQDPIPRLADVLSEFPTTNFNIDAKSDAAVDLLADTIEQFGVHERVCVGSFSVSRLRRLRERLGPRVASSVNSFGIGYNRFVPVLPRFVPAGGEAFQMPVRHRLFGKEVTVLTPTLIERAHRHGQQVHVWTINDPDEMNRLIDLGVDGLVTDRIDTLADVLRQRGLWSSTP